MSYENRRGASDNSPESLSNGSKRILRCPEVDRMLDILRKRHRRLILLLVKDTVVETEVDVMVRDRDGAEPTEMELFHNHLPKLADAKYIEWDREAGTISEGPRFDEIKPLLELLEPHVDEPPADWS